jgi:hypothetical protein
MFIEFLRKMEIQMEKNKINLAISEFFFNVSSKKASVKKNILILFLVFFGLTTISTYAIGNIIPYCKSEDIVRGNFFDLPITKERDAFFALFKTILTDKKMVKGYANILCTEILHPKRLWLVLGDLSHNALTQLEKVRKGWCETNEIQRSKMLRLEPEDVVFVCNNDNSLSVKETDDHFELNLSESERLELTIIKSDNWSTLEATNIDRILNMMRGYATVAKGLISERYRFQTALALNSYREVKLAMTSLGQDFIRLLDFIAIQAEADKRAIVQDIFKLAVGNPDGVIALANKMKSKPFLNITEKGAIRLRLILTWWCRSLHTEPQLCVLTIKKKIRRRGEEDTEGKETPAFIISRLNPCGSCAALFREDRQRALLSPFWYANPDSTDVSLTKDNYRDLLLLPLGEGPLLFKENLEIHEAYK